MTTPGHMRRFAQAINPTKQPTEPAVQEPFTGTLEQHTTQLQQAFKQLSEEFDAKRADLRARGYHMEERTDMFERWVHPNGDEVTFE